MKYPYLDDLITEEEALNQFINLRDIKFNTNKPIPHTIMGNKLIHKYFDRQHAKMKARGKSYLDIFNNEFDKVEKVYKSLNYPMPYEPKFIKRALEHINYISIFKPAVSSYIVQKYKPKYALFSPQMGWGEIMLGALANDIDFIGIDSNIESKKSYDKMINLIKPYFNSKVSLIFKDSNKVDLSKYKYDLVLVSPPYEEIEKYPNQPEYDDFYKDFLIPSIKKTYEGLMKGGNMIYNVPEYMYDIIKKQFKPANEKIEYPLAQIRKNQKGKYKEYLYVWKKGNDKIQNKEKDIDAGIKEDTNINVNDLNKKLDTSQYNIIMKNTKDMGIGVFAQKDFKKGEFIFPYVYKKSDIMDIKEYNEKYGVKYLYNTYSLGHQNKIIFPKERTLISYINNSKNNPNVILKSFKLYATKNISKGEQLFLKYYYKNEF